MVLTDTDGVIVHMVSSPEFAAEVGPLGLRVGDTASWCTPNGDVCEADIVSILFQPEASGDFTT